MPTTRREVISGAIAVTALGATSVVSGQTQHPRRRPNFVFILADDLGAFDLSCYGREDYQTPNIDRIARRGMRFELGYASSSSCAPTRVGLISGRYQNRLLAGSGEGGGYTRGKVGYSGDLPSLPGLFKAAGYRTGLVGKWGIGELPDYGPRKSGYDEFFGLMGGGIDYWSHDFLDPLTPGPRRPDLYENETQVEVDGYATDLFSERACDFIRRNVDQPFMLSLHYTAPHWPWQTREERGSPRMTDMHYEGGSPKIFRDMVLAMDQGIGKVLDTLRKHRLDRDTVIIFTSDNGGERFSKMWPLRGGKGELWEGGTRVPLIVSWPGRIGANTVSRQVAVSMDFLPTMAALAGIVTDPSYPPDGIDLSPQLFGAPPVARTIFWMTPGERLAALSYPWKFLRNGTLEYLYNLDEDPSEHANFRNRNSAVFDDLKVRTTAWSARMQNTMPAVPRAIVDQAEALETPNLPGK